MPTATTLLPEPVATNVALPAQDQIVASRAAVPYLYEGLSRNQRLCVVFVAVFIVFVNMVFGAHVMYSSAERVPFGETDQKTVAAFSSGIQDPVAAAVMRSKSIDAVANMKLISNKQAIVIVAFAGAFSMTAIGFALFVLGSDGVFRLQGEGGEGAHSAKLIFSGTAPGLFCFLVAAGLIASGIFHRTQLQLGETVFPYYARFQSARPQPTTPSGMRFGSVS